MFMTSNGLAPLILTADSQGGAKDAAGTDPVTGVAPESGPGAPADIPEGKKGATVEKTLSTFVEDGDHEGLAAFLRQVEQGALA